MLGLEPCSLAAAFENLVTGKDQEGMHSICLSFPPCVLVGHWSIWAFIPFAFLCCIS